MKNNNSGNELGKLETITTIIVNIGTIISWVTTLVTALALVAQTEPIKINDIFQIGTPYKIAFLISVLFGYIQLLRHFWTNSRFKKAETESSFAAFLYVSIIKFKRPVVLVGFLIIFAALFQVEPFGFSVLLGLTVLFGGATVMAFLDTSPEKVKRFFWQADDEFRKRWLKRVKNELYNTGYVHTSDFKHSGVDEGEINWAIEAYFNRYEFEQDLILSKKVERFSEKAFLELRFSHLPTLLKE